MISLKISSCNTKNVKVDVYLLVNILMRSPLKINAAIKKYFE